MAYQCLANASHTRISGKGMNKRCVTPTSPEYRCVKEDRIIRPHEVLHGKSPLHKGTCGGQVAIYWRKCGSAVKQVADQKRSTTS